MKITASQARSEVAANWAIEIERIKKEADTFIEENIVPAIQTSIAAGKTFIQAELLDMEDSVANRIFEVLLDNGFDVTVTSTPIASKPYVGTDFTVSWEVDHNGGKGSLQRPKATAVKIKSTDKTATPVANEKVHQPTLRQSKSAAVAEHIQQMQDMTDKAIESVLEG